MFMIWSVSVQVFFFFPSQKSQACPYISYDIVFKHLHLIQEYCTVNTAAYVNTLIQAKIHKQTEKHGKYQHLLYYTYIR